jgi:hypothetical protein
VSLGAAGFLSGPPIFEQLAKPYPSPQLYGKITTMPSWMRFLIAVVIGAILGLVYGWEISPIQYVDTAPSALRADYRADYVLAIAEAYKAEQDIDLAARRLAVFGSQPPAEIVGQTLDFAHQADYSMDDQALLRDLNKALQAWQPVPGGNLP